MTLEIKNVSCRIGDVTILRDVSFSIANGSVVGLLGPNGSGKSTLLRTIAGLRQPTAGSISIDGNDLHQCDARERARILAFVEQQVDTQLELSVLDTVVLGRMPHRPSWQPATAKDRSVALDCLGRVDLAHMETRKWSTLSGGERQRVQLARALAQQPTHILLDEPTNHLDIRHQLEFLSLLKASGLTALVSLHDLNLAASYCDSLIVLNDGAVRSNGPPTAVIDPLMVREVFGVDADIGAAPQGPFVRFLLPNGERGARPLRPN